jgi:hypothetical protein
MPGATRRIAAAAVTVAGVLVWGAEANAAALDFVLDDFTERGFINDYPLRTTGQATAQSRGLDNVPGGGRDLQVNVFTTSLEPGFDFFDVNLREDPGFLDFTASVGATGTARLFYGSRLLTFGQQNLGLDLSDYAGVLVDFDRIIMPVGERLTMTLTTFTGGGTFNERFVGSWAINSGSPLIFDDPLTDNGNQSVLVPFGSPQGFGSMADLADVNGFELSFGIPTGTSFRLNSVSVVVPEPASMALLAAALPLVLRRSRRMH